MNQQGSVLIITFMIISALLVVSFASVTAVLSEVKKSSQTRDALKASYAAESGLEYALYQKRHGHVLTYYALEKTGVMETDASWSIEVVRNLLGRDVLQSNGFFARRRQGVAAEIPVIESNSPHFYRF